MEIDNFYAEVDGWPNNCQAIQDELFTGQFHIFPIKVNADGTREVQWRFIYRNMGMDHELTKHFLIGAASAMDKDTGVITIVESEKELRECVFRHYERFDADVMEDLCGLSSEQ